MPGFEDFNGFYAIYYQGDAGPGLAQMQLIDGEIIGADATGGIWEGKFVVDSVNERIDCEITIRLLQGVPLATTGRPPIGNETANMKFGLPLDFAMREYVALDLPIGRINVRFQKIR